eukprot:scaffold36546_cov222-Skeletonema_dohrnii-CCMP3373.AAC.3
MEMKPTQTDVLSGRGVSTNNHKGNENFRNIIIDQMDTYAAGTKSQKMAISKDVVHRLQNNFTPPGRFLKKDSDTKQWVELTMKEATGKTAQAFAYAIRDRARKIKEENQKDDKTEEPATRLSGTKRPAASLEVANEGHSSASTLTHSDEKGKACKQTSTLNKSTGTISSVNQAPLMQQQPQPQLQQDSAATMANSEATTRSMLAQMPSSQQQNASLQNVAALQQLLQQQQLQQQLQQQQGLLARAILIAQQQQRGLQASQSLLPSSSQAVHSADELLLRQMLLQGNPLVLSQEELRLQGLLLQSNPLALSAEQLQLQASLRNSLQSQSILSLGGGFNNQHVLRPQVQPNLQQQTLMQQVNTIAEFLRRQQDGNDEQKEG